MKFAPGAYRWAAVPLLVGGVAGVAFPPAAVGGLLLGLCALLFFRDPDRLPPSSGVISPADGTVSVVREEPVAGRPEVRADGDGGIDAESDGATDAESDGGIDAESGGATDAESDGGTDVESGGATDAESGGATDAESDGGTDADGEGRSDPGDGNGDGPTAGDAPVDDEDYRLRVGVFMNVWNVHVNRTPVTGEAVEVTHEPGGHRPAFTKDSDRNERMRVRVDADDGEYEVVQIAGAFARRITSYLEDGDELDRGDRIGHVAFGSRADVVFPPAYDREDLAVEEGDSVRAGESVLLER
jgi:phosphatidylserine decarboxylase